jgi:uncharacterized protein YjdB
MNKENKQVVSGLLFAAIIALFLNGCDSLTSTLSEKTGDKKLKDITFLSEEIAADTLTLNVGATYNLAAALVFTPSDAQEKGVLWSIDNEDAIITLNEETGVLTTGNKAAYDAADDENKSATITATALDGNKQASVLVTVVYTPIALESIAIAGGAALDMEAWDEADLTATPTPADANNYTLAWASSDTAVAAVDADGHIIAGSVAENSAATITVTAGNGDDEEGENEITATVTVNVAKSDLNNKSVASAQKLTAVVTAIGRDAADLDKEYTITVTKDITITQSSELINTSSDGFKGKTITLTDDGAGRTIKVRRALIENDIAVLQIGSADNGGKSLASTLSTRTKVILTGKLTLEGGGNEYLNGQNFVLVNRQGVFELDGNAKITGNKSASVGAVEVKGYGEFYMKGGEISGNTAGGENLPASGGGVVVTNNARFHMSGGVIAGNTVQYSGSNEYGSSGGALYLQGSTNLGIDFQKTGGIIYGNDVANVALRNIVLRDGVSQNQKGAAVNFFVNLSAGTLYRDTTLYANDNLSQKTTDANWNKLEE